MKTPICSLCLESSALCSACEKKLNEREISELDVDISRFLNRLEKKFLISEVEFVKSHELNDFVILVVRGNIASVIGKAGRVVRMLSDEFGKKFRVVLEGDLKDMMQDLVFPARVFGINVLYTSRGEEYVAVIPEGDRNKILLDEETLKKATSILFNKEINIKFSK